MISTKRYVVELLPEQTQTLGPEHLELGTCVDCTGSKLLIFRDNFVAYKVATLTGGTVRLGQIVAGEELEGALALGDGTKLLLEEPVTA